MEFLVKWCEWVVFGRGSLELRCFDVEREGGWEVHSFPFVHQGSFIVEHLAAEFAAARGVANSFALACDSVPNYPCSL